MSNLREIAVLTLHKIIHPNSQKTELSDSENNYAFSKMLYQTSLRNYVSVNKLLNLYLQRKIPNKNNLVHTTLICAITEMLFMDSPAYAIINSYVEIIKKHCNKYISGFANAILRNILKNIENIKNSYETEFFPDSFKKILQKDYKQDIIKQIEQSALTEPPLNITVKDSPDYWSRQLSGTPIIFNSVFLPQTGRIDNLPGYNEGAWWVQDISASLAANYFSDISGKRILDLCAAPGGKTAQLISMGAKVTSLDASQNRLQILQQNLQRLKLSAENIICCDAIDYLQNFNEEPYDGILLDAPCSATGVFRRHPEIVHIKKQDDINKQALLQKNILEVISPALKTGGELIYCTCSIAKTEGEEQILNFIKTHNNYKIAPLQNPSEPQSETADGFIRTLPFHYNAYRGCDAFFIAKLTKEA